ncbi:MAG: PAS domain-containing sensor histidine kinase [Trichloromonadaceae bacterium]
MTFTPDGIYRVIFETTRTALAIVENDLTIALVNPEFEYFFDTPKAAIEGRMSLLVFVAETDRARVEGYHWERRRGGHAPINYEAQVLDRAGNIRYALLAAALIPGSSRTVLSVADISGRKQVENHLAQSQVQLFQQHDKLNRLFRQLAAIKNEVERTMDCIDDWLVLVGKDGCIRRCNQAFRDFSGQDYSQIIGSPLADQLSDLEFGLQGGAVSNLEICHETKGRWYSLETYPFIDENGAEDGSVLTARDITDIKQINNQLQATNRELAGKTAELEQAYVQLQTTQSQIVQQEKLATLGQLAAGVAHEINNPMGFITSNLTSLQNYLQRLTQVLAAQQELILASSLSEERLQRLEQLQRNAKLQYILEDAPVLLEETKEGASRVAKIVQDLKTFSRVDSREKTMADINSCLDSTLNMVASELRFKAQVVKNFGELPPVYCYPNRLNQVFMNLLVNAAQAIETQGIITIGTRQEGEAVVISVADTGCGIPPQSLPRLCEPFFTTKEAGKGTGLGLSIASDIIREHGGELTVASELGHGTVFTIRLPKAEVPAVAGP